MDVIVVVSIFMYFVVLNVGILNGIEVKKKLNYW